MTTETLEQIAVRIANSKKYRSMDIPQETILDLLEKEIGKHPKKGQAIQAVKAKLHNIIAPYLDTLDYPQAAEALELALAAKDNKRIEDICVQFLQAHQSTKERIPYMHDFYRYILNTIGDTCSIIDLACGMNPFMIPVVSFPQSITYYAYDIHTPRINLIKRLFSDLGIQGAAEIQDILVQPPKQKTTAAFLFKEAHRMEKRRKGASKDLTASLKADYLFISLPSHSLNGKYDLRSRMYALTVDIIEGLGFILETKEFPSETLFTIGLTHGKA